MTKLTNNKSFAGLRKRKALAPIAGVMLLVLVAYVAGEFIALDAAATDVAALDTAVLALDATELFALQQNQRQTSSKCQQRQHHRQKDPRQIQKQLLYC